MLYSYYVYLYTHLKLPVSAPADPLGTAPLHRHTMSALPPVRATATSGGVSSDRIGGDSPVVIHRDSNGVFTDDICFYCTNFRTHYRCTALVPNGYFTLDLQRVCGRYFCHECSPGWSQSDNRNRCHLHIDVADGQEASVIKYDNVSSSDESDSDLFHPPFRTRTSTTTISPSYGRNETTLSVSPNVQPEVINESTNNNVDHFQSYAVGQIYEKKAFVSAVRIAANKSGFEVSIRGTQICCTRSERKSDGPKEAARRAAVPIEEKRKKSALGCGCNWVIRWQPNQSMCNNQSIRITSMILNHTNGCTPSKQQLRVARRRSGTYTRAIPMNALKEVINLLGEKERLPHHFVRKILKPYLPGDWNMDSVAICNFLVKCRIFKQEMETRNDRMIIEKELPGWIQMTNTDPSILFAMHLASLLKCYEKH